MPAPVIPRQKIPIPGPGVRRGVPVKRQRVADDRGAALMDQANATNRGAAQLRNLAATVTRGGNIVGAATKAQGAERARGVNAIASARDREGNAIARALEQEGKDRANATRFLSQSIDTTIVAASAFTQRQDDTFDTVWEDRLLLRRAQEFSVIQAEANRNADPSEEAINGLVERLKAADEAAIAGANEDMGGEASSGAQARQASAATRAIASSVSSFAVAGVNQRAGRIINGVELSIADTARSAAADPSVQTLNAALEQGMAQVAAVENDLTANEFRTLQKTMQETVIKAWFFAASGKAGSQEEIAQIQTVLDKLNTGTVGAKANVNVEAIYNAMIDHGVDPLYAIGMSRHETAGTYDPQSVSLDRHGNRVGTAAGVGHMIKSMSLKFGGPADLLTATVQKQADLWGQFTRAHQDLLQKTFKRVTPQDLFTLQILGSPVGMRVLKADPDARLNTILTPTEIQRGGAKAFANGTVQDWLDHAENTIQTNMDAAVAEGLVGGRTITKNEARVSINFGIQLQSHLDTRADALVRAEAKRIEDRNEAFSPATSQKKRNPVGILMNNDPDVVEAVRNAADAMQDEKMELGDKIEVNEAAVDTVLAAQEAIALEHGYVGFGPRQAKVLEVEQAKVMVASIREDKGIDALHKYGALLAAYGKHKDKVHQELLDQGLPPVYSLVGIVADSTNPSHAQAVAKIINADESDIKDNLGDAEIKVEVDLLKADLVPFRQALEAGVESAGRANDIIDALVRVKVNEFRLGRTWNEAHDFAMSMIEENHEILQGSRHNVIIPRSAEVTSKQLEDATAFKQRKLELLRFEPDPIRGRHSLSLPPPLLEGFGRAAAAAVPGELIAAVAKTGLDAVFGASDRTTEEEFSLMRTVNAASNYGKWFTNEDNTGVVLKVPIGTQWTPVVNEANVPYEIKWEDVPDLIDESFAEEPTSGALVGATTDILGINE